MGCLVCTEALVGMGSVRVEKDEEIAHGQIYQSKCHWKSYREKIRQPNKFTLSNMRKITKAIITSICTALNNYFHTSFEDNN